MEFYRLGLADRLKEQLERTGLKGDEANSLVKNSWMRRQLRPAFKSVDDFNDFMDAVTIERGMYDFKQHTLGGSPSAARLAEDTSEEGLTPGAARIAYHIIKGNLPGAIRNTYHMWQDLGMRPNPELNAKLAEILFSAPTGRVANKLKGKIPPRGNPQQYTADVIRRTSPVLAPGAAAEATREEDVPGFQAGMLLRSRLRGCLHWALST